MPGIGPVLAQTIATHFGRAGSSRTVPAVNVTTGEVLDCQPGSATWRRAHSPGHPHSRGAHPDEPMLVVTGMSGAGRSTMANVLEDLGWFVVDNLPPQLLPQLAELRDDAMARTPEAVTHRVAVVVDVRRAGGSPTSEADRAGRAGGRPVGRLPRRHRRGARPPVRERPPAAPAPGRRPAARRHPAGACLLVDLRSEADVVIDSSGLNVHQLAARRCPSSPATGGPAPGRGHVVRFKYGLPLDADVVFDMRFLPNPFWVPELRAAHRAGRAGRRVRPVPAGAEEFLDDVGDLLDSVIAGYVREGRRYVTVAVGCTGGKHRSVAIAERSVPESASTDAVDTFIVHRDLGRE